MVDTVLAIMKVKMTDVLVVTILKTILATVACTKKLKNNE